MRHAPKRSIRVEQVLARAGEEATRLGSEYVGTAHVLLALTADTDGVAVAVFQNLGVDLYALRQSVETELRRASAVPRVAQAGSTSGIGEALELAESAAREMGHPYLGTEHVLLGVLRQPENIAARLLEAIGVGLTPVRAEIQRILGPPRPGGSDLTPGHGAG